MGAGHQGGQHPDQLTATGGGCPGYERRPPALNQAVCGWGPGARLRAAKAGPRHVKASAAAGVLAGLLQEMTMKTYVCIVCGFVYDEAAGRPEDDIAPGTIWAHVPDNWACPDCGVTKADFEMVEL